MKIIQIGNYPMDKTCIHGGVEASVYGLTQELIHKHEVIVMDIPRSENDSVYIENKLKIYRFKSIGKNNLSNSKRVKDYLNIILREDPDICHLHGTSHFNYKLFKQLYVLKIPVIVTIHGLAHVEKRQQYQSKRTIKRYMQYLYQSYCEFYLISHSKQIIVDTHYV